MTIDGTVQKDCLNSAKISLNMKTFLNSQSSLMQGMMAELLDEHTINHINLQVFPKFNGFIFFCVLNVPNCSWVLYG